MKKRSKGVTFWGWAFIIFSIIGLLQLLNPQEQIKMYGIGFLFLDMFLCMASLVCGIFILKLNEKARRAAIFLAILGIVLAPIYVNVIMKNIPYEGYYAEARQKIIAQVKPEHQKESMEAFEKNFATARKAIPIVVMVLIGLPFLIFEAIPLYFFTRPKVREQFKAV